MSDQNQSSNLPFPKLEITNKTTKKDMAEYIEKIETYAQQLLALQQSTRLTPLPETVPLENVVEKDRIILELQETVNKLQGELTQLKGHNDLAQILEQQMIENIVPQKRKR